MVKVVVGGGEGMGRGGGDGGGFWWLGEGRYG